MAGIQFINTNPAIDQFNAQVQRGDQARRLEEEDFMRRFQLEQAMGTDKARRAGAEVYFASQPAAAPPIAQFQAAPQAQTASAPPAQLPPQTEPSPFGEDPRLPAAQAAPAISAVQTQPMAVRTPAAGQDDRYTRMAATMAKTPGTGADLLHMVTADATTRRFAAIEERKLHMEGIKLFTDASKNGDVATMRAVSQRYDLGIPPEALNRREIMANIAAGVNTAKSMGITDDQTAIAFGMGYVESIAIGADPRTAIQAGLKSAQGVTKTGVGDISHWEHSPDNTVWGFNKKGERLNTGFKARPPQPPFSLSTTAGDMRDQGLRDKAMDNARTEAGRRWDRMAPDEKQSRIDYHYDFLKTGKSKTPPPSRSAGAPAAAPGANNDPLGLRRQ